MGRCRSQNRRPRFRFSNRGAPSSSFLPRHWSRNRREVSSRLQASRAEGTAREFEEDRHVPLLRLSRISAPVRLVRCTSEPDCVLHGPTANRTSSTSPVRFIRETKPRNFFVEKV